MKKYFDFLKTWNVGIYTQNEPRNNPKWPCKVKAICHNFVSVIVRVLARISMQIFMKNIEPFSRNIEDCSKCTLKKTQNSPSEKYNTPIIKYYFSL